MNIEYDQTTDPCAALVQYKLRHGRGPSSIGALLADSGLDTSDLATDSLFALEQAVWEGFFNGTVSILIHDPTYAEYSAREKLLAFYYTWLETLKNHRDYAVLTNRQHCLLLGVVLPSYLDRVRPAFLEYVQSVVGWGLETGEVKGRLLITERYGDGLWYQFLFLYRFWLSDRSEDFQKSDEAVERIVNLSFDLMGENVVDELVGFAGFLVRQWNPFIR